MGILLDRYYHWMPEHGTISEEEFRELYKLANIPELEEYEYADNFVVSKYYATIEERIKSMCCGIYVKSFKLSNGEKIYIAFDYGH